MYKPETRTFTLKELADLTSSTLVGNANHTVSNVDALDSASYEDVSFLANPRYAEAMRHTQAGVVCVHTDTPLVPEKNFLISDNPSHTFQQIAEIILLSTHHFSGFQGIHPTAIIHPTAVIEEGVSIGPYAVIDQGVHIGKQTRIDAHVAIASGVQIGKECILFPHAVVRERCILGDRVILQPSAVIGSCGFGYITDAKGHHIKLNQLGIVILEDDVEIGACTTIDRARFKTTRIGKGTKIDNLVQIGHNVELGPHNIIVSQTGIAGSSKTGKHVILGGQAGVVGHVEIADNIMIATRGGVSKSITKSGKYAGGPAMPLAEYNRLQVHLRKVPDYAARIDVLEKRLKLLEETHGVENQSGI